MNYVFGIDLGTTNSCIAVMKGTRESMPAPMAIPFLNGKTTLPSCVWYKKTADGFETVVGREAYENRHLTDEIVYSSKRFIGTDKVYSLHEGTLKVTPVDVAAEILKTLKENAERLYGKDAVKEIVITVPAYFNHEKRHQTKLAAEKAGMSVLAIINEPTAAALSYSYVKPQSERFLVYDLGGGTFDVTVMDVIEGGNDEFDSFIDDGSDQVARVIASAGDDMLGGDDLDRAILECAMDDTNAKFNAYDRIKDFDVRKFVTPEQYERFLLHVEQHKKNSPDATIVLNVKSKLGRKMENTPIIVSEAVIKRALEPLYARTKAKVTECTEGIVGAIDKMILVGGSTKLALLRNMLAKDYPNMKIYCELNPDEAVALGAAVQAAVIKGGIDMIVSDVLPQSIGVDCQVDLNGTVIRGRFKKLVAKNTVLPAEMRTTVTNISDNQKEVAVAFYQGEDVRSANNTYLGTVVLDGLNLEKSGESFIELIVKIDANGMLSVDVAADGKTTHASLINILRPTTAVKDNLPTPIRNMLNSLESAILNSESSEEETEALLEELSLCKEDTTKIPALKAKVQKLTNKIKNERIARATSVFATQAAVNSVNTSYTEENDS